MAQELQSVRTEHTALLEELANEKERHAASLEAQITEAQVALATTSDDLQAKNDGLAQELQSVRTEHTALLRAHATLVQSHTKCAEQAESLEQTKALLREMRQNQVSIAMEATALAEAAQSATETAVAEALESAQAAFETEEEKLRDQMQAAVMHSEALQLDAVTKEAEVILAQTEHREQLDSLRAQLECAHAAASQANAKKLDLMNQLGQAELATLKRKTEAEESAARHALAVAAHETETAGLRDEVEKMRVEANEQERRFELDLAAQEKSQQEIVQDARVAREELKAICDAERVELVHKYEAETANLKLEKAELEKRCQATEVEAAALQAELEKKNDEEAHSPAQQQLAHLRSPNSQRQEDEREREYAAEILEMKQRQSVLEGEVVAQQEQLATAQELAQSQTAKYDALLQTHEATKVELQTSLGESSATVKTLEATCAKQLAIEVAVEKEETAVSRQVEAMNDIIAEQVREIAELQNQLKKDELVFANQDKAVKRLSPTQGQPPQAESPEALKEFTFSDDSGEDQGSPGSPPPADLSHVSIPTSEDRADAAEKLRAFAEAEKQLEAEMHIQQRQQETALGKTASGESMDLIIDGEDDAEGGDTPLTIHESTEDGSEARMTDSDSTFRNKLLPEKFLLMCTICVYI